MRNAIRIGNDRLFEDYRNLIAGKRIGVIGNPTSVDSTYRHLAWKVSEYSGATLAALFGPEHGIWGAEQDMISVQGEADPHLGVPVYSLYGETVDSLRPPPGSLANLDVLLFDIQDVGSRYYTYIYTMMLAMEEAAKADVTMVVLDRPNPIGGQTLEGNVVKPGFGSFVGLHPLATRHSMTAGELAFLFRAERNIDVDLQVVPMEGWQRQMWFEDTGVPWVMPSPNMPTVDTAVVYPGMCLLEGTNLSEGRGTTRPFELFGAPYLDAERYAHALNSEQLEGAVFRPVWFRPTFQKHGGTLCGGVQLHVTDRNRFSSVAAGIAAIVHARAQAPEAFQWRKDAYEFVEDIPAIDLLFGEEETRLAIESGQTTRETVAQFDSGRDSFHERRKEYLLYGASA